MKTKEITKHYQDVEISFTTEAWFNATRAAVRFGKRPAYWLRTKETKEYLVVLSSELNVRICTLTRVGRGQGKDTWMHPELGVAFARWLEPAFRRWCDRQIKAILIGTLDVKRARHQAASSYKVMQDVLALKRQEQGKETLMHHYTNESRLINWALTGQFTKVDRDSLERHELDLLARLEERNATLIGAGLEYDIRKLALQRFVDSVNLPLGQTTRDEISER